MTSIDSVLAHFEFLEDYSAKKLEDMRTRITTFQVHTQGLGTNSIQGKICMVIDKGIFVERYPYNDGVNLQTTADLKPPKGFDYFFRSHSRDDPTRIWIDKGVLKQIGLCSHIGFILPKLIKVGEDIITEDILEDRIKEYLLTNPESSERDYRLLKYWVPDAKFIQFDNYRETKGITQIKKVLETKNGVKRVALTDSNLLFSMNNTEDLFNYLDEGRLVWKSPNHLIPLWVSEDADADREEFTKQLEDLLWNNALDSLPFPCEKSDLDARYKKRQLSMKRQEMSEKAQQEAKETVMKSLEFKSIPWGEFVFHGMKKKPEPYANIYGFRTMGVLEYEGQKISVASLKFIYDDLEKENIPNFCQILQKRASCCLDHLRNMGSEMLWVGNFRIKVSRDDIITKDQWGEGLHSRRYYIEGIPIKRDDFSRVVSAGLEFTKKKGYVDYVAMTKKTNLLAQDYLSNGVTTRVSSMGDTYELNFQVKKVGVKWFIKTPDDWLQIAKGMQTLQKLDTAERDAYRYGSITGLPQISEALTKAGLDKPQIKLVINKAIERHKEVAKRAQKLLNETVKENKGKVAILPNGRVQVKGMSGKLYEIEQSNCGVYDGGRYVCIIDKGLGRSLTKNDRIVARIYALMNDSKIAKDVHTLRM